jgi:hypothetical protein
MKRNNLKRLVNVSVIIFAALTMFSAPATAFLYQDFERENEYGGYGWAINGATAGLTTTESRTPTHSWQIVSPVEYGGAGVPCQVHTNNTNFEPTHNDRLVFWIKAVPNVPSDNDVRVRFFDNGLYNANGFEVFTTKTARYNQWTELTVLFTQLPPDFNLTSIDKINFVNARPGTYYIDDIHVALQDRVYQTFEPELRSGSTASEYGWKWNDADNVGFSSVGEPVYEGQHSWKLTTAGYWGGTGIQSQEQNYYQGYQSYWHGDLNPAKNDRLTFWVYSLASNGLENNIGVQFYDHGQHSTDETKAVVWTKKRAQYGHWTKLTVMFSELPATLNLHDLDKIQFQVYWPGTYYFDDIRATQDIPTLTVAPETAGLLASWNGIPGAIAYELQQSQEGPDGPWQTIYNGNNTSYYPYPLSSKWFRVHWMESQGCGTVSCYVSQWSEVAHAIRPPALLKNPSVHITGLQWDEVPFADQYEIQKGPSKNGPWLEIYRGPRQTLPAVNYYELGAWYRIRADLRNGPTDIVDSTDWSPALPVTSLETGYLKAQGKVIKEMDGLGDELLLRGVNLGNWLLNEPGFSGIGGEYTPLNANDDDDYSIRSQLVQRFGSVQLLNSFQDAYLQKEDLDYLMRLGINLVRVPIYYQSLQDSTGAFTNFAKLDWLIEECSNRGIYVLLDLHGAPGAQSNESHSGRANYNKHFENSTEGEAFRTQTVNLWRAVASRYVHWHYVAGYDLLNEPFGALTYDPTFTAPNGLWTLYNNLYNAVRAVDPYHIIVMESIPSTYDWETLPMPSTYGWSNVVYQLHYYGFEFDNTGKISGIKDVIGHRAYLEDKLDNSKQENFNVPVLVGEFNGFNQRANWDYFINAFRRNNWSWAMWTYKAHQQQYPTEWGLFMHEKYDDSLPDVSADSELRLQEKFSKYDTVRYHTQNFSLADIINSHLSNLHPQLATINDKTIKEGVLLQFPVTATDPQGKNLTLSATLIDGQPLDTIGATFEDQGNGIGSFSWWSQGSSNTRITFWAVNSDGWNDSQTVKVSLETISFPVIWVDPVGVSVNGSTLTKTGRNGWNSGAASAQKIIGDGGVEFTIRQTNASFLCGLAYANPDTGYTSINYAFGPEADGKAYIWEQGVYTGMNVTYQIGDRFRIERNNGAVSFKKNGIVVYTSPTPSSGALIVDSSLYHNGCVLSDAKIVGVTPTMPEAVTDLKPLAASNGSVDLMWTDPVNNGPVITAYVVQYGTVASGTFNQTYVDDATPGATVTGLTNGTQYQFRVVARNESGDSTASNVTQATPTVKTEIAVVWIDPVGVAVNGNSLTKTGVAGWNGGAASVQTFSGDGGVDFTVGQANASLICGLAYSNPNAGYTSINYAFGPEADGKAYIWEQGVYRGVNVTYQAGDRLRIERSNGTVFFKKNGVIVYTSPTASSGALLVDSSLYHTGAVLSDAKIVGVTLAAPATVTDLSAINGNDSVDLKWTAPGNNGSAITGYVVQYGTVASGTFSQTYLDDANPGATITGLANGTAYQFRVIARNAIGDSAASNVVNATPVTTMDVVWVDLVGVTANGNTLTKTAGKGWSNGGAASAQTFSGNGGVDFTVVQTNVSLICGLSYSNPNANYASINYAFGPEADGKAYVWEQGVYKGVNVAYLVGDRFRIERIGSTVVFKKNGVVVYTSPTASSGALMVDCSLYHKGAVLSDAKIVGVSLVAPVAVADLNAIMAVNGSVDLKWTAPGNNGSAITAYVVQYGTVASGAFSQTYVDDSTPGAKITGLTNGTAYQFRVIARNAIGDSTASNVVNATPVPSTDVVWLNPVGVLVNGNSLTKTGKNGWNSGAASTQTVSGNGGVDFTVGQTNASFICGLAYSNPNAGYASINYAFGPEADGKAYIWEQGVYKGVNVAYQVGDRFRIERIGNTVFFKKNGVVVYTSPTASSGALLVDSSLYNKGCVLSDAKIVGVTSGN